ncbi:MAG: MFS transporter [Candidatus Micrarchaeota archaeon]
MAKEEKQLSKGIGNNVITLGIVSFFTDISSEMIFPLIPVFLTTILGAGKEVLGLIEGIADSTASLVEIISGYFSDKTGKRKQLVLFGYGISSFVKLGIALSNQWWQVLIMRGLERIGKGVRTAPRDAIIADSADVKVRGKAYGLHRMMDTLGAIIGPAIAYLLLSWYGQAEPGYRAVFFAALIPAFLAVLVVIFFVREPEKVQQPAQKTQFWESLKQMPAAYKTYLKISLFFSLAYFSFAFFIVRANDLGISAENILLLYLIYNIVYAAAAIPTGMLSDKIGRKPVIAGAFALYAIVCLGFVFAGSWLQLALLFAAYGIFVAADESVNKAYIIDISAVERRGMALGAYNTAIGAAYLPASIIAGVLWTMYGPLAPLSLAAGIALIAAAALMFCCKE